MKFNTIQTCSKTFLAVSFSVAASLAAAASAEPALQVKTVLDDRDIELYSPRFVPNSSEIVVVRKAHEPDFHEAEAFTEKELNKSRGKADQNPRWADPEVTLVSSDGKDRKVIDHGWSPEATPKGDKIYYIKQVEPISGKRVLADTQKGNALYSFEIPTSTKRELVIPTSGYIDAPRVHQSEQKVAYDLCDHINGAYGGAVGIGVYDETTGKSQTCLEPAKHFKLFDLIGPTFWNKASLITLRQTPKSEGVWLADEYTWDILKLENGSQRVLYKNETPIKAYSKTLRISETPDGHIELIDGDKLSKLNAMDGTVIETQTRPDAQGMPSPDRKFEAILTEDDSVEVTIKASGEKLKTKMPGQVQALRWSPDSASLAAIVTKNRKHQGMDVFDRDTMLLIVLGDTGASKK